jgi:hypothetical protein
MTIKRRLPVTGVIDSDDNPPIVDNTWLNSTTHKMVNRAIVAKQVDFSILILPK